MTWAKIDDQLHAHLKAKRAWKCRPALGLHLLAMSYCASQLTDGLVDHEFVAEKLPSRGERERVTAALVESGLWEVDGDGFRIHDWLTYNPSRADVLEKRVSEADRRARARAAASTARPQGVRADVIGTPEGRDAVSERPRAGTSASPHAGGSGREVVGETSQGTAKLDAIREATAILSSVWQFVDPVGVENAVAGEPDAAVVAAARLAATWGSDETWRMGPAASLRAAIRKLHSEQSAGRSKGERATERLAALKALQEHLA